MRFALLALLFLACRPFDPLLCAPCHSGGCGAGLTCVEGACVSETERCGILERPEGACGDGPPCGDGFECFQGGCHTPIAVEAGGQHTCALWRSGRVSCWGQNADGQAGGPSALALSPEVVDGIEDAVDLSLGWEHSCALRATGDLLCWGSNSHGQLGNFDAVRFDDAFEDSATPVRVFIDRPIVDFTAGALHTCARDDTDQIYCWGRGGVTVYGPEFDTGCMLGDVSLQNSQLPLRVSVPASIAGLDAGWEQTVGLVGDRVYGWGVNYWGQLGDGPWPTCTPVDIGLPPSTMLATGASHVCALGFDGAVHCKGLTDLGQAPTEAIQLEGTVHQLDAALHYSCARLDRGISCWGARLAWLNSGTLQPEPPTLIPGTEDASLMSAGGTGHLCFLRSEDGIYCLGPQQFGQVGDRRQLATGPTRVLEGNFVEVATGANHACARTPEGRVLCWGRNHGGAVGNGFLSAGEGPTEVSGLRATRIVAGAHFSCAIDLIGDVYCWGSYDNPEPPHLQPPGPTPRRVYRAAGATSLVAGNIHACAHLDGGARTACWGFDQQGEIDGQPNPTRADDVTYDAAVPTLFTDVEHLTAGDGFSCGRTTAGLFECQGQTGSFDLDVDLSGVTQIDGGTRFLCGIAADRTAFCWGLGSQGRLGDGTARDQRRPNLPVFELNEVVEVSLGQVHACARRADGQVLCWGQDAQLGRLGLGQTFDRVAPVSVPGLPPAQDLAVGTNGGCIAAADGVWCWGFDTGHVSGRPPFTHVPQRVAGLR